jgi:hypothetical protein
MKTKNAKLFICHHPGNLLLYKNLIQIIKKYDRNVEIVLFKINHPYFLSFDFEPSKKYFDQIVEFDFIHYKKNLFQGLREVLLFQKKLKKISETLLSDFEKIDLFLDNSAYLPINVLLYNLSRQGNVKNITKFSLGGLKGIKTKIDKVKTFLCALYSLSFKCYKIKILNNLNGQFMNFVYAEETPGKLVEIISPIVDPSNNFIESQENILPYPVKYKKSPAAKKDMIIIFGKGKTFQNSPGYFSDYGTYVKKLTAFFKTLEKKYSNCKLCYKYFPLDGNKVMPGINTKKYVLFDNNINAQELIEKYQKRIKAIYTPFSVVAAYGSFFGIPSYTFYRYLCNPAGIERFDSLMNQGSLNSKFLFHLESLDEIGKIDNLKFSFINSKKLKEIYRKTLYI